MRTRSLGLVLAVAALLAAGACSSSDDDASTPTGGTTADQSSDGTTAVATDDTTATKSIDDLSNSDIRAFFEEEHPDEYALVDWDIISWAAFGGYTVTIESGSTAEQALAVCEAMAEIVYEYTDEQTIEIVADDVTLASVESVDGTCAAA